jgi:two-component system, response regulator
VIPQSVLLVEDNSDDEFLAVRTLRKAGVTAISVARDGEEALAVLLAADRPLPDLLLLDLRLPKIDGLELMAKLRDNDRTSSLPVIVLSSSEDPRDHEACRQFGIRTFLSKPLDIIEFKQALATLPRRER